MRLNGPWVKTGAIVTTVTGRQTAPVPRLDFSSSRKATSSIVRLHRWLMSEVLAELEFRGAGQMEIRLSGALTADPTRLTPAEVDGFILILWG